MIGKIERVPLREVWKHEARDFTSWLQDNLDVLAEVIDLNLASPEREQSAGDFSVDLIAEDESGNLVVIENQLERSNHDHLGKLVTYLVAVGAKTAIWIVSDPRPEHVGAITWLNESSAASFYLLKLEGVRIGASEPAPLLTLIVGPSAEGREVGETKKELASRFDHRLRFWTQLLERAKAKTRLHSTISPGQYSYISTSAGQRGLSLNYVLRKHHAGVELYIDRGDGSSEQNKSIFDRLAAEKAAIEGAYGGPLEWQRLDDKRASRIRDTFNSGGYLDDASWPGLQEQMIDAMVRLEKALRPHLVGLQT
jgi:hypothetical protein